MGLFGNRRDPDVDNIRILSAMLSHTLKAELVEAMVKDQLDAFEAKVRPLVEERVKGLSLHTIEQYMNLNYMTQDFRLEINWRNPPEPIYPK